MGAGEGERLGILGGTFDPVHVGHLAAAVNARASLSLDRILLVVANQPWQKTGRPLTPAGDRLAMVAAAVAGRRGLEASAVEIERGGTSYTADTLEHLAAEAPGRELFLVVGADVAAQLDTWERLEAVVRLATLAVVVRPGSPRLPAAVVERPWRVEVVEMPALDISSSEVRRRCRAGLPLDFLVPDPVIDLIGRRGLYAGGTMTTGSGGR